MQMSALKERKVYASGSRATHALAQEDSSEQLKTEYCPQKINFDAG